MKYSSKGRRYKNRHENGLKRSGQAGLVYVKDINRNHVKVSPLGQPRKSYHRATPVTRSRAVSYTHLTLPTRRTV